MRADVAPRAPASRAACAWEVTERVGSPRELHAVAETPAGRKVVISWTSSGAVVLGSTQPESDFEPDRCASAGFDLVRRRSGGGAVLVQPGAQVWADFYLPAADPLFCTDVSASFIWLGELWAAAVRATTGASTTVEVASSSSDAGGWARRLCFCGITRGEVTLSGKKAVGLCQRRDRAGAWFHTMALTSLDAAATADLVAGSAQDRRDAAARLESSAVALPGDGIASALVAALLGHLGELDGGDRKAMKDEVGAG